MFTEIEFNITPSKYDDDLLTKATGDVFCDIKNKYLFAIPDTWNLELETKKLRFKDIKEKMIEEGLSVAKANAYYGADSSIDTDAHIIFLTIMNNGKKLKKPLFMGEIKKQGTNDKRLLEGKKKQAIGNAAPDRVAKNYMIASDYCYFCDKDFFPYNVFLHGCDFSEDEITETTKAKLQPLFGTLNQHHPFFDKDIFWTKRGGSCFYQGDDYTYDQLYTICYKCCEIGLKHYIAKYRE